MDELFIEHNLPEIYNYDEQIEKFKKLNSGDKTIRNDIIYHNMKLVLDIVNKYYYNVPYCEKKDLVSLGMTALVKSVDTYKIEKNVKFSTYATKCIKNEIKSFLKKNKNLLTEESLDKKLNIKDGEKELTIADKLYDENQNIDEDYVIKDRNEKIRKIVNNIPGKDGQYIRMYFGFDCEPKSANEISKIFKVSRQYVCQRINNYIYLLKKEFEDEKIIEKTTKRKVL